MMMRQQRTATLFASAVFLMFGLLTPGAAIAAAGTSGAASATTDLPGFLNALGKKVSAFTTLKTDFTQEKEMALFTDKIVLSGRIFIQKPNRIAWHVDKPFRYSVLITDKMIRQWDEDSDQVQELSLIKNPILRNVLDQMTVWFSGDFSELQRENSIRVLRNDPLVIECVPRAGNMAGSVIKNITITFRQDQTYLQKIRIQELSGDVTSIIFSNTVFNAVLDQRDFEVKPARQERAPVSDTGHGPGLSPNGAPGHV